MVVVCLDHFSVVQGAGAVTLLILSISKLRSFTAALDLVSDGIPQFCGELLCFIIV